MIDFKDKQELSISEEFKKNGYLIFKSNNVESLEYLRKVIIDNICKICHLKKPRSNDYDELKEHTNCVSSYNELAEKNEIVDIKYSGERDFGLYKRFMVIGTW